MTSDLGKQLRIIRINEDEKLLDMAGKLGVSPSFLSAVEKGHKSPPNGLEETIILEYNLNWTQASELRSAADRSRHAFTLRPTSDIARDTVGLLARRMDDIPDIDMAKIQNILKKNEKK
jgi:transcriptional regulator with XRE-family HTH domain